MTRRIQRSFSGGEVSEFVYPLTGIQKRNQGFAKGKNAVVRKFGTFESRGGTEHFLTLSDSSRIVSFVDSSGQRYLAVFSPGNLRVWDANGNLQFHFQTGHTAEMINRLQFSQQSDVLVVTSYYHPPTVIRRTVGASGNVDWEYTGLATRRKAGGIDEVPNPSSNSVSSATDSEQRQRSQSFAIVTIFKDGSESAPLESGESDHRIIVNAQKPMTFFWEVTGNKEEMSQFKVYYREDGVYRFVGFAGVPKTGTRASFAYIGEPPDVTDVLGTEESPFPVSPRLAYPLLGTAMDNVDGEMVNVVAINAAVVRSSLASGSTTFSPLSSLSSEETYFVQDQSWNNLKGFLGAVKIKDTTDYILLDALTLKPIPATAFSGGFSSVHGAGFIKVTNAPNTSFFYGQRLFLASTLDAPEKIWASRLGDFRNFSHTPVLTDTSPYDFSIASRRFSPVRHMAGLREPLVFTDNDEWSLGADTSATGVTPSPQSSYGIGRVPPEELENAVVFTDGQQSVRDFGYDFQTGGYRGNDLTTFSSHLFEGEKIISMAYQKNPTPVVWVVLESGRVRSLTYFREQNISAWCQHDFGGKVIDVETVNQAGESDVFFVVQRDDNFFIEKLAQVDLADDRDFRSCDSHVFRDHRNKDESIKVTFEGGDTWGPSDTGLKVRFNEPVDYLVDIGQIRFIDVLSRNKRIRCEVVSHDTPGELFTVTVDRDIPDNLRSEGTSEWAIPRNDLSLEERPSGGTPLAHLNGKEVAVYADGSVVASPYEGTGMTVQNGQLDLGGYYSVICVGLPFVSDLLTLPVDLRGQDTLGDENLIINKVSVYLHNTRGIYLGTAEPDTETGLDGLTPLKTNFGDEVEISPENGLISEVVEARWAMGGVVFIRQVAPLPMNIQGIVISGDLAGFRGDGRVRA